MGAHDVLIIGAGAYGLACAWKLAAAGQSVLVLERDGIGTQASGFALGRIDPLLGGIGAKYKVGSSVDASQSGAEAGNQLGLRGHRLLLDSIPEIESISGLDLQLDQQPTLQFIYSDVQLDELKEQSAGWVELGYEPKFLDVDEVRKLEPRASSPERGGLLIDGPFFIDALRYVQALAACSEKVGVTIQSGEVTGIDVHANSVEVETSSGARYSANRVLITAGPWSSQIANLMAVELPIHPSKGEILRLGPLESGPLEVHLHDPSSLVQKKDGQIWSAATAADVGFDRTPTPESRDILLANARQVLPEIENSTLILHTVCFRPVSQDGIPIIGQIDGSGSVWIATGGGGSGIMQSLAVAESVAKSITTGLSELSLEAFSPARF
ncbi:MAG: FAD-dependent oxidoreductase [Chloroflexi bacterium]|nr:FAD-dependent oxidoreductase [Chloroflexota bacterium]